MERVSTRCAAVAYCVHSPRQPSASGPQAPLKIKNNESEKSSPPGGKRHATQVVIGTTTNDTAPNRRRYGTSGGPWPTRGAPLARAGLEPGPGSRSRAPWRRVVSSACVFAVPGWRHPRPQLYVALGRVTDPANLEHGLPVYLYQHSNGRKHPSEKFYSMHSLCASCTKTAIFLVLCK